ncbi:hypothetical protein D0T84_12800 [Dysgonomonas sp. 521]|uniref:DKNYY domain-containing protein n=1 Tax=Dysgonomonas sp. 521 TaxID=2302932 RepID=UPI0013D1B2DF|nr:DKNYY domain-containing protein [Dysgonomonas sp. 521]NDV95781.1 hypothetical protein [Dysgonomonas sp. 521]
MIRVLLSFIFLLNALSCLSCDPVVCSYSVKGNRVYYTEASNRIIVRDVIPASFSLVKDKRGLDLSLYAKDNKSVFYRGIRLKDADPHTFEVLGGLSGFYTDGYSRDKKYVYFLEKPIDADVETFIVLHNEGYAKDKNHVFRDGQITNYDPSTFQILAHGYTLDKSGIYYNDDIIAGADPYNFEQYDCYIKSNSMIFMQSTPSAFLSYDAASFEVVHAYKSTDSCGHSSFLGAIVKDKNGVYAQSISLSFGKPAEKLAFDPQSFKRLTREKETIFEDKNGLYDIKIDYYKGVIIENLP